MKHFFSTNKSVSIDNNIFINDLPDVVSSTAKIFADDTKLFRAIRIIEDHDVMQQDLDNLIK